MNGKQLSVDVIDRSTEVDEDVVMAWRDQIVQVFENQMGRAAEKNEDGTRVFMSIFSYHELEPPISDTVNGPLAFETATRAAIRVLKLHRLKVSRPFSDMSVIDIRLPRNRARSLMRASQLDLLSRRTRKHSVA